MIPREEWPQQRQAAAFFIRQGRQILRAGVRFSDAISGRDSKAAFSAGQQLIAIGRRIAMGYQLEAWTDEIYRAHLNATRPKSQKGVK